MSITPGTKLGQYEVQDFIGQGAMGMVFRAYHSELERTGAVKVLQAISPDRDTKARFRHEAQAIAQLRHPNIVNVYDFGEYQGTPYMIVEYVPGGSLADRMGSGRLEPGQALKFLRGIAAGLDYAHGVGVIHRDVKPANVLLEKDDTPVLADFGLAKLVQGSSLKSMTGATTGTPAYMAPEQVTGSDVGPAADRYSLATIAYEMLAGVIPFEGQGLMEILYAHSAMLQIIDPVALIIPPAGATPGAAPTATPGTNPQPTAPGAGPRPVPAPKPVPTPTPAPKPPPSPTPTPTPGPVKSIALNSVSVTNGTSVTFKNFPAGTVSVCVWQNGTCHSTNVSVPAGTNTVKFTNPPGIVPTTLATPWQAHVVVGSLTSLTVTVVP